MRVILAALPVLLMAGACTQTPAETARAAARVQIEQEGLAKELAGLVPGKPMSCLDNFRSTQLASYGPTILYRVSKSLVYRTETGGGCTRVGRGDILVTRSPEGRTCAGDISQTFDTGSRMPTGSCSLGQFVPYRKP